MLCYATMAVPSAPSGAALRIVLVYTDPRRSDNRGGGLQKVNSSGVPEINWLRKSLIFVKEVKYLPKIFTGKGA